MGATADMLDMKALRRAIESRDAAAQAAMFADDATVSMVDHDHPPSSPHRLQGRAAIRSMLDDVCSRDMTHRVTHALASPDGVAYTVECRYADGMRVEVAMLADVRNGMITHQEGVQAWDPA